MKHRNPEAMRRNAAAAIPDQNPLSANQIFRRQALPRLPLPEVRKLCEELYNAGEVDRIEIGFMVYYRRRPPREYRVAPSVVKVYTPERENKFFPVSTEVRWLLATLYPLIKGSAVFLRMQDPRAAARIKNYRGAKREKLVVLVPGQAMGTEAGNVLVAVIGSGSCVIRPEFAGGNDSESRRQRANLVSAGMPVDLASTLMNQLHQLYKE